MRKLLAAALVLLMAGWVLADAKPGVLRTKDGVVYDGLVDEGDKTVTVNIHGIDTTIQRDNIASITYGDFEQRWNDAYDKLDKKDAVGRVAAGKRAFDNRRYDLAEKACRDAIAIDPNNADAAELLQLTINQRRMERAQPAENGTDSVAPPPNPNNTPGPNALQAGGIWSTLSPEQINRVKQLEVRDTDTATRFAFDNNVRKKFYDDNPGLATQYRTYGDFLKETQISQATQIIQNGGDLAKDVRVVNDPDVMLTFRRDVMPLVLQGCATSGCHGGNNQATDKFALITPAADPATIYTDFYMLETTQVKRIMPPSQAGPAVVGNVLMPNTAMMIDRTRPESSLLLQYGLPDLQAQTKHPHVRGYNGVFRSSDDTRYKTVLEFITSLNPITPDYGFKFKLERSGVPDVKNPSTLPANAP